MFGCGSYRGVSLMPLCLEMCSWVVVLVLIAVLCGFCFLARDPGTVACYTLVKMPEQQFISVFRVTTSPAGTKEDYGLTSLATAVLTRNKWSAAHGAGA